jgi:CrcB protein
MTLNIVMIALGAAVGANLRYGLSLWAAQRFGSAFPYGTLIINVLGSLLIGAVLMLAATRVPLSEPVRLLIVTGLLGGFTTFSSFSFEVYALIMTGNWGAAALYAVSSFGLGLAGVFAGAALIRLLPW